VGGGTRALAEMRPGEKLELLTGLGNGFDIEKSGQNPLLIGGGAGVAPLYGLAEALLRAGKQPKAILGFNSAADIFLAAELTALGIPCCISTADGSVGVRGFVTDVLRIAAPEHDYLFVCGPEPMLKAVYASDETDEQYSFEARMACGFGACMCCSKETKNGPKRICQDGPVLERGEILW
jgi:dihydroorotate dehydrogenase electron transfer subunit